MAITDELPAVNLPALGSLENSWGTGSGGVNEGLAKLSRAAAGYLSKSVAGGSNVNLTQTESENVTLEFTGLLTGDIEVRPVSAGKKWWIVFNNTTGAFTVTFVPSGASGVVVPQGGKQLVFSNGTNIVAATGPLLPLSSELTIASGVVALKGLAHTVDTEGDASSDDLATITAGPVAEGSVISLLAANSGRKVYLVTGGNIAHPCLLSTTRPARYMLIGSTWYCLDDEVLLDELTASGSATLDFVKGIGSAYDHYEFRLTNILPATDVTALYMRVTHDGADFEDDAADYEQNQLFQTSSSAGSQAGDNTQGDTKINLSGAQGNAAGEGLSGRVEMFAPGETAYHSFLAELTYWTSDATPALRKSSVVGAYNGSTAAINGVRFLMNSGNIAGGRIALYGRRK